MKKLLLGLISFIMVVSLCGCGNNESSNDSNQGSNDVNNTVTIELTMDNWQDYFELGMQEKDEFNEFDELECTRKCVVLILKDEFTLSKTDISEITIELSYDLEKHYYTFNEAKNKVKWLDTAVEEVGQTRIITTFSDLLFNGNMLLLSNGGGGGKDHTALYVNVYTNAKITKIKGNLYLNK